jgi:hypothetical protein
VLTEGIAALDDALDALDDMDGRRTYRPQIGRTSNRAFLILFQASGKFYSRLLGTLFISHSCTKSGSAPQARIKLTFLSRCGCVSRRVGPDAWVPTRVRDPPVLSMLGNQSAGLTPSWLYFCECVSIPWCRR